MTLTVWKDTTLVWLLDNCVDRCKHARIVRTEGKRLKSGARNALSGKRRQSVVPEVIIKYNQYMGRVDDANSARSLMSIDRKNRRKHIRTYLALIEFYLLTNTAIIFADELERKQINHKQLRIQLIHDWIYQYKVEFPSCLKPRRMTFKSIAQSVQDKSPLARHQLIEFDRNKRSRQIKCKYCYNFRHERYDTTWACSVCATWTQPVGLCKNKDCFDRWHEELKNEWAKSENNVSNEQIQSMDNDDLSIANVDWETGSEHSSDDEILCDMDTPTGANVHLRIMDSDDDQENVVDLLHDNGQQSGDNDDDNYELIHNYLLNWFGDNPDVMMVDEQEFVRMLNMDSAENTGIESNLSISQIQKTAQFLNDKHNSGTLYNAPNICYYEKEPTAEPLFN